MKGKPSRLGYVLCAFDSVGVRIICNTPLHVGLMKYVIKACQQSPATLS